MNASEDHNDDELGVAVKELLWLTSAATGNEHLCGSEEREGWEESLVGCIKDARLFGFGGADAQHCELRHLLFALEPSSEHPAAPPTSRVSRQPSPSVYRLYR
jgi:hypothetical protein